MKVLLLRHHLADCFHYDRGRKDDLLEVLERRRAGRPGWITDDALLVLDQHLLQLDVAGPDVPEPSHLLRALGLGNAMDIQPAL
eukprot:8220398-Pyramimonas_sp.AAC.1